MRKRKWRQVVAVVLLGCATSIAVGQNPWRVGSLMGGEVRGETSTGVPWSWLSLRMWGQAHRFGMKEWGVGVSHGGWRAWNQTALLCGGQHRSTQKRSSFEWLLTSSLVRWPDVSRKAGHARLECAGSQHHPWGIVRMQAHVEWGQTRTWWLENPHPQLPFGPNRWGWEVYWSPALEGANLPLPELSWGSGGQWSLAWSSAAFSWSTRRLWRAAGGKVALRASFPDFRGEVAWRIPMAPSRSGDSTEGRAKRERSRHHALRMGTHSGGTLTRWCWGWEWKLKSDGSTS